MDPAQQNRGVGRVLGQYVLDWARSAGFKSIPFNAVVESNQTAVHLWQSLGYDIVGTAPASFDHPEHGLVGLYMRMLGRFAWPPWRPVHFRVMFQTPLTLVRGCYQAQSL